MADKKKEDKIVLEREYIVNLRRTFHDTQKYKRARKAVKDLAIFVAKHMTTRDVTKIKIDRYLNEEIWSRGMKKPIAKIKIKCKKFESGIVRVELAEIPEFVKWKMHHDKKRHEVKVEKKAEEKKEDKTEKKTEEEKTSEDAKKIEEKEKEKSVMEAGLKHQDLEAREVKHEVKMPKIKNQPLQRKAMQR